MYGVLLACECPDPGAHAGGDELVLGPPQAPGSGLAPAARNYAEQRTFQLSLVCGSVWMTTHAYRFPDRGLSPVTLFAAGMGCGRLVP